MDTLEEIPPQTIDKETAVNDNDCCIVELEDSEETVINHISSVYSLNEAYVRDKQSDLTNITPNVEPASIVIDVDSEIDNDLVITTNHHNNKIINKLQNSSSTPNHNTCFDDLHKENPLLTELIEKCLNMENNNGMLRVIHRTLVPLYRDSDETYKKSDKLEKILIKTIRNLEILPEKKFSHIKTLCEELKKNKGKKRVQLVTLTSNLNGEFSTSEIQSHSIPKKRRKLEGINEVVNLDEDDDVIECISDTDVQIYDNTNPIISQNSSPVHIVNVNETNVVIDDTENDSDVQINDQGEKIDDDLIVLGDNFDKENRTSHDNENSNIKNDNIVQNNKECVNKNNRDRDYSIVCSDTLVERNSNDHQKNNKPTEFVDLSIENDEINTDNSTNLKTLETPYNVKDQVALLDDEINTDNSTNLKTLETPYNVKDQVAVLEKRIASFNELIKKCEEAEVCEDSLFSPYVQAQYYKLKVVSYYKEICKLMGTESVKRHNVRLKVVPGHPEGPVRFLEQFINDNIGENGEPPFPDMHDVTNCVNKANLEYNLGWNKKQIENEARALFIHYGRTAQKRRQKREWRHLLSYVKEEVPDPADVDPALNARLNENAIVAKKKEDDLLAKYAAMENSGPNQERPVTNENINQEQDTQNSLTNEPVANVINNSNEIFVFNNCNGNITNNLVIYNPWNAVVQISEVPIEFCNPIEEQNIPNSVDVGEIKPVLLPAIVNNDDSCNNSNIINNLDVNTNDINTQQNCEIKSCSYATTNVMHNDLENVNNNVNNPDINQNVVSSTDEVTIAVDSIEVLNDDTDRNAPDKRVNKEITNLQDNFELNRCNKSDAVQINEVTTNVKEPNPTNNFEVINTENSGHASSSNVCENIKHAVIFESFHIDVLRTDGTSDLRVTRDSNNLDNRLSVENRKDSNSFEELSDKSTYEIVFDTDEGSLQTDINTDVIAEREPVNIEDRVNENSDIGNSSRVCDVKNTCRTVFESDIRYQKTDLKADRVVKKELNNIEDGVNTDDEILSRPGCSGTIISRLTFESDVESIKTDANNDVVKKVPNKIEDREHTENDKLANDSKIADNVKDVHRDEVDSKNTCRTTFESSEAGTVPTDINNDLVIKEEPLDIASMLEQLGKNYTATVIDIEDPFLVIEISDSSESEDEE